MGDLTSYSRSLLIEAIVRGGTVTFPTELYVALHTGDPTIDGTANEIATASYVRQGFPTADFGANVDGACSLNTDVAWPTAGEDWGTATWITVWDAASAGHAWFRKVLPSSRAIPSGATFHVASGNLVLALS